jgi:hypothetical protein
MYAVTAQTLVDCLGFFFYNNHAALVAGRITALTVEGAYCFGFIYAAVWIV